MDGQNVPVGHTGVDEKISRFEIRRKSIIMCRWE